MVESQEGFTVSFKLCNSDKLVIIDEPDFCKVWHENWYEDRKKNTSYARSNRRYIHTVLTGSDIVDHKDRDGLNNTGDNIRSCTRSQNSINYEQAQSINGSGYRGVTKIKRGWQARINIVPGQQKYLGSFDDPVSAARAYDTAAKEHHGEFAILNFPEAD